MARENSAHAPGNLINSDDSAIRQHVRMGEGKGAMAGGSFGVGPLPGTRRIPMNTHVPHDGMHLADHERANPPTLDMGKDNMGATAHSHHGPHGHQGKHHDHMPEGNRPHHVGHRR